MGDGDGDDDGGAGEGGDGDGDGDCAPGDLECECPDSLVCQGELVCAGGLCVESDDERASRVIRVEHFGIVIFHDSDGSEVWRASGPATYDLPEGGSVSVLGGDSITTFGSIPDGATLAPHVEPAMEREALQSIAVNVPDVPDKHIHINTGCSGASDAGEHVLAMDTGCLHEGTAELYIYAWESGSGAYIHVDDIELGDATEEPLVLALPDYTDFEEGTFTVENVPPGGSGYFVDYSGRGAANLHNSARGFEIPTADVVVPIYARYPDVGVEWFRVLRVENDEGERRSLFSLGHPFPMVSSYDAADLMPQVLDVSESWDDERRISWTLPESGVEDVDLVRVRLTWTHDETERAWDLWLPPGSEEVVFPTYAQTDSSPEPTAEMTIEVFLEQQDGIEGWDDVLAGFLDVHSRSWEQGFPTYRLSSRILLP